MIYAGIDAGSRAVKIVIYDKRKKAIIDKAIADQAVKQEEEAVKLYNSLLKKNGISSKDISFVIATGYGRDNLQIADDTVTEITCHAKGVKFLNPNVRSIIEIGGQDSKIIKLDEEGAVRDFSMNDRCAAGTGRFLEVVAERLNVPLNKLGEYAIKSESPAPISSMCVVFAESEIIGLLSIGTSPEDIIAGVQNSIAKRLLSMSGKNLPSPIVFTGGVALVPGMEKILKDTVGNDLTVSQSPQLTGALGAALIASTRK